MPSQGVTKPGQVRKIKGEGMPVYDNTKKGDLFVTFAIVFPDSLTEEQKEVVKKTFPSDVLRKSKEGSSGSEEL